MKKKIDEKKLQAGECCDAQFYKMFGLDFCSPKRVNIDQIDVEPTDAAGQATLILIPDLVYYLDVCTLKSLLH